MTPEVFEKSALNPFRQLNMCSHDDHSDEDEDEDENAKEENFESLISKIIGNIFGTHEGHGHAKRPFYELLVISENSEWYTIFNLAVTFLCLFSVYYYGSIAGFRYSEL
jgi:hypothetical protein